MDVVQNDYHLESSEHLPLIVNYFPCDNLRSTLSNFEINNTISLTLVITLYLAFPERRFVLFDLFTYFPYPLNSGNHQSDLFVWVWSILVSTRESEILQYCSFISLSKMPSEFIHVATNGRIDFSFMAKLAFLFCQWVSILHVLDLNKTVLIWKWARRVVLLHRGL